MRYPLFTEIIWQKVTFAAFARVLLRNKDTVATENFQVLSA